MTRQKVGVWGEDTFVAHIRTHPEYGLAVFPYGEAYTGTKKAQGPAVNRPDLLLMETTELEKLASEGLKLKLDSDLRKMADDSTDTKSILMRSLVALEVKFSHRRYEKGHVAFILDEGREKRYKKWLTDTRGPGALMVWMTTDHAWIATFDQILKEGKQEIRTYEMRGGKARQKNTWNLPVEDTVPFASVTGYELNRTLKPSFKWTTSGGIEVDVNDDLGDFKDMDLPLLRKLAKAVRRP